MTVYRAAGGHVKTRLPAAFFTPMTRKYGQFNEEYLQRLEDVFIADPNMTLVELSKRSKELCGQHISKDRLSVYSTQREWFTKRNVYWEAEAEDPNQIAKEVAVIRKIIYDQIKAQTEGGIMALGNPAAVEAALKNVPDIEILHIKKVSVDPALINAYMNLLQKSKIDLSNLNRSAKTGLQRAKEIASEAIRERSR